MTEKVYLTNPYLKEIKTRVIEKYYQDEKYFIITEKTIFHPNLVSGQPRDKGSINGKIVSDVFQKDSKVVHVIDENINSDMVTLAIDWENRLDYMQQHSAQHLLSAAFYKLFNCETIDFFIDKEKSYIDLDIDYLNSNHIKGIEEFVNRIIFSNFSIKSYINEDNKGFDENNYSQLRIVEIDSIDFSPCLGTHLRNTGEIGIIKILEYTTTNNKTRVEFIAGKRALNNYSELHQTTRKLYEEFKVSSLKEFKENLKTIKESNNFLSYENKVLLEENLKLQEENLKNKAKIFNEYKFIFSEITSFSPKYVNELLEKLSRTRQTIVFVFSESNEASIYSYILKFSKDIEINISNLEFLKDSSESFHIQSKNVYGTIRDRNLKLIKDKIISNIIKKL